MGGAISCEKVRPCPFSPVRGGKRPWTESAMLALGRLLQLVGLIILPVAIAGNLANERLTLMQSLTLSAIGVLVFSLGWLLQQRARPH